MQTNSEELRVLSEPLLSFGYGQKMQDPRDGLFLFGPLDDVAKPARMRIGLIGTSEAISRYKRWVQRITSYIPAGDITRHAKAFPGFQSAFGAVWPLTPIREVHIPTAQIHDSLRIRDRHQAIFKTVGLFENAIRTHFREEDAPVDIWFVVIPEEVHRLGRPKSVVPTAESMPSDTYMTGALGRKLLMGPSMFQEDNIAAKVYRYEINFHHQLKARLLDIGAVVQIVRETSLTPEDFVRSDGRPLRRLQDEASIAWNLTTTAYFKAGGRPWKLASVRDGVCYIGLVFKIDTTTPSGGNACCGAQMFLDSGDGLVFKGAVGPWYSSSAKEFHISQEKAKELITKVVESYSRLHGSPPKELFIHGKTHFGDDEWNGFQSAVPKETKLVGVRIRDATDLKLYSPGNMPVLRGTIYRFNSRHGYLWTKGFIPQLKTYPGREIPNALDIQIDRGDGDLSQVMQDILGLTKVNFNACIFADGYPVTLRFADAVGEILTAAPISADLPPLPFRHYI